ncbi:MAG: DNA mismatch repair endonuclease MutL [Treponemataceae bacterium]|nr:DNA mismatch repair endonuclease MutL [Treponemataceae bacterium]
MGNPVRVLSAEVARKIAAGEVIDRPAAIVRELLDNAVDSGADDISMEIAGGGIERIRVADNGSGMSRDDLTHCARPHATSKITDADDLLHLTTLGFRGEALASIAAVSRLSIMSGTYKMRASITEDHIIETIPPVQNGRGTIVQSEGLFENFPARRQFLKRASSETMLCRELFVEKALPRTDIAFRLTVDGALRADLPRGVSLADRFTAALGIKESPALFSEIKGSGSDWKFRLIIGEPGVWRNDRKQLFVYVNGRRVQEYALMQAVEYGCQGFFPNGTHPVAALFVEMNPALVDFNIHPAKKEVRFKDSSELHHGVSSTVRAFFRAYGIKAAREYEADTNDTQIALDWEKSANRATEQTERFPAPTNEAAATDAEQPNHADLSSATKAHSPSARHSERTDFPAPPHTASFAAVQAAFDRRSMAEKAVAEPDRTQTADTTPRGATPTNRTDFRARFFDYDRAPRLAEQALSTHASAPEKTDANGITYIGNTLGTFILIEKDGTLYFIDQHAAHERILFDRLMASSGETQELLVPYTLTTAAQEDDDYIASIRDVLRRAGFTADRRADGTWEITTVPVRWTGSEQDLRDALLERHTNPQDIIYRIAAMTACKAAVKDGFVLDKATSAQLAKDALALPDPHCPHGRPVWTTITKEQLFARVRRTR